VRCPSPGNGKSTNLRLQGVGHLVGTGEEFLVDSLQKRPWPHLKVWVDRKTFEKLMSNDQYGLQPAA
jgi:hypothetical protein